MMRLVFALVVMAAAAAAACQRAERPAEESESMQMMSDTAMMSDTGHMMAGDTAQRM